MHPRFVFGTAPLDDYCHQWLQIDANAARLSLPYRAYYQLRPFVPTKVRQWLQHRRRPDVDEEWYVPTAFLGGLAAELGHILQPVYLIHPWPDRAQYAFVLTHDVETAEGFGNLMAIADMEEALGFRSAWNLVPHAYRIDAGIVRELTTRGFEIGIHGYNHDGRLFASRRVFDRRVVAINRALAQYQSAGFRAPMVHRNLEWMQSLAVDYESSCFDIDPFQAMPGGIGSIWPCMIGKFVELPYTLSQDHTLFIVLGMQDGNVWERKLDVLRRCSGLALMLTHPDYLTTAHRRSIYEKFLTRVKDEEGYWHALPRDVARWWRARDASVLDPQEHTIRGPAGLRGTVAKLEVRDNEPRMVQLQSSVPA